MIRYKAIIDRSHTPHMGEKSRASHSRSFNAPCVFLYPWGGAKVCAQSTKEATKRVYLVWLIFRTVLEILASFNVPKSPIPRGGFLALL
ncbi:hypothetical protein BS47DRAFT_1346339 [Hydnum rufescens UP504]|uniref:Uncharacterized protein n=1 Tax=Hydnum rufescens UP504 TaxID=1448309 RepID=A0A9P6ATM0_9AGAM|nr:hypothetical protein BS47DRAFT_1346339 [Hydnum rufescens UP504]